MAVSAAHTQHCDMLFDLLSPLRVLTRALLACTALVVAASSLGAQTDVIRGRVTNPEGLPLTGVRVTATSIPGNVTRETRTSDKGLYQIAFPGGTGDYMMGFALIGYVFRQFEIKRLADEEVLIADARLTVIQLDTVAVVTQQQQRVGRNSQTPDVSGTERPISPATLPADQQGDIAAMAASLPGVLLVPGLDGAPDGFSVLGLGADQNSVTLNGLQVGANGLPRDANISTSLTTSPYDVSRGGFSGANFNIRSGSGSNFRSRGMSFVGSAPQMQWTDPAARALGAEYTNLSLGGVASGPLKYNKAFYNVSFQLGRQARDNQTLLGTSAVGLETAGIAMDSVGRFINILEREGVPSVQRRFNSERLSDNGSLFGSIDISPPNSSSGQSFGMTFNGNWGRQSPVGGGVTQLPSSSGDHTNWSGGFQARHNGYLKLILSETSAGINVSRDYGNPYVTLPSGRVRVNSLFDDGVSSVQTLAFGGNQGLSSTSRSVNGTVQNNLSWFDDANKHRIKLTTELGYSASTQNLASNLLGSFYFNSLEDLDTGLPASFSRTLTARRRSTGQVTGSMAIGDSWRKTTDLQIQYGLRVDASHFLRTPEYNPAVERDFGLRNDHVPTPISVSPRVGFSWTVGRAPEVSLFSGASRTPRAVIRGGIGVFTNGSSAGQIGSALDNTGLPSGVQQVYCVGPAVPIPDWSVYATNASAVPDRCADGTTGTVFANPAPNVTLFARGFRPQRTVRTKLSWNGNLLDNRYSTSVEGTYSLNLNQQRTVDLNFTPLERFTLADEIGRPVYVDPASIVSTSGSIASRDARVSQSFSRVSEVRSDLQSRTAQLSVRVSPIPRGPTKFGWSAAYTFTHIREQVSGFSSTAGNPLSLEWARSGQGPHQISYNLRYNFFNAVQVNWNGSFRSGSAFTPTVAGDINGDGYSNDRAFIYGPSGTTDPTLAAGMTQLLASTSGAARECLQKQLGRIAERNSCRGPWTSNASLNITLDRAKFRMPQRAAISFSISNPLGAADLLVNGSGNLRGWGQNISPDQALLYVRGFDPNTRRYTYEVNQRFGATRPQFLVLRNPATLTASVRYDLGPMRERQTLGLQLGSGRTLPGSRLPEGAFRSLGAVGVVNPMVTILRQQDSLRLTARQADSVAAMNRRYTYRTDSIWAPVARYLAALPAHYDEGAAYDRYLQARHAQVDMLIRIVPALRELLTDEQRRKLPQQIVNVLDPRYLVSVRNGTGLYVGGAVGGFPGGFGPGGFAPVFFAEGFRQ
jgi:hypothetical protein